MYRTLLKRTFPFVLCVLGSVGCMGAPEDTDADETTAALKLKGDRDKGKGFVMDKDELKGVIKGRLTSALTGQAIVGAEVLVQKLDQAGQLKIVGRAKSQADGTYQIDKLPFGDKYIVGSQPKLDGKAFETQVSAQLRLDQQHPIAVVDHVFKQARSLGNLQVQMRPIATGHQSDTCMLMQSPLGTQFIVGEQSTGQSGQAQFWNLPTGQYGVKCLRTDKDERGATRQLASKQIAAQVLQNVTQSVQIAF